MGKYRKYTLVLTVMLMLGCLCSCETTIDVSEKEKQSVEVKNTDVEEKSIFDKIAGTYFFSDGRGVWKETIVIKADGTFKGYGTDINYEDSGDNYVATEYVSEFEGKFSEHLASNDIEYEVFVEKLTPLNEPGKVEFEKSEQGDIRKIHAMPFGMELDSKMKIYAPSSKASVIDDERINILEHYTGIGEQGRIDRYMILGVNNQAIYLYDIEK